MLFPLPFLPSGYASNEQVLCQSMSHFKLKTIMEYTWFFCTYYILQINIHILAPLHADSNTYNISHKSITLTFFFLQNFVVLALRGPTLIHCVYMHEHLKQIPLRNIFSLPCKKPSPPPPEQGFIDIFFPLKLCPFKQGLVGKCIIKPPFFPKNWLFLTSKCLTHLPAYLKTTRATAPCYIFLVYACIHQYIQKALGTGHPT